MCTASADSNQRILNDTGRFGLLDRMMLADQLMYLPDDLLAKVDRASMAVSLEVRAPLLDHRVVELSWRLPSGAEAARPRRQVGAAPDPLSPRAAPSGRPAEDGLLRSDRRAGCEVRCGSGPELLSPERLAEGDLLDPAPITRAWEDLQTGRRRTGAALWAVAMFQGWKERWA